jgi:hypothetical protein
MFGTHGIKKAIICLAVVALFASFGFVYASLTAHYNIPQSAIAPVGASASITINGQPWTNGTAISWGQLQMGTNTIPITLTNTGSCAINSVIISNTGLPTGWTETITMGTPSGSSIPGIITLNADASVSGSVSWTSVITISGP